MVSDLGRNAAKYVVLHSARHRQQYQPLNRQPRCQFMMLQLGQLPPKYYQLSAIPSSTHRRNTITNILQLITIRKPTHYQNTPNKFPIIAEHHQSIGNTSSENERGEHECVAKAAPTHRQAIPDTKSTQRQNIANA